MKLTKQLHLSYHIKKNKILRNKLTKEMQMSTLKATKLYWKKIKLSKGIEKKAFVYRSDLIL